MTTNNKQPAASDLSESAGSVIRELKYLLRKMGNPPRGCMCSQHIEGQDANRAEVRKLLRERIEFHSQNIEVAGCEPANHAQHNRANSHSAH